MWGSHNVTDEKGESYIIRHIPDIPNGEREIYGLSELSERQRGLMDAAHELGHAVMYLHFGSHAAVSMIPKDESRARVLGLASSSLYIGRDQRRIALAAGEVAGLLWLKKNSLDSPLETFVNEIRSNTDRKFLRDELGITFGTQDEDDFDLLIQKTEEEIAPYLGTIFNLAPRLLMDKWWDWETTARNLGFPAMITPLSRMASEAIRESLKKEPGTHNYDFAMAHVTVITGSEDWEEINWKWKE